jgi:AP-3 complex subunit mu
MALDLSCHVCPAETSHFSFWNSFTGSRISLWKYFGSPADEERHQRQQHRLSLPEEMVDYGLAPHDGTNALKADSFMIIEQTLANDTVSEELPSGTVSNMPWRAANVNYNREQNLHGWWKRLVDAIVNSSGR